MKPTLIIGRGPRKILFHCSIKRLSLAHVAIYSIMSPLIIPSPDVRYRIQNVDFGAFLERRFNTAVVMRAMKDSLEQQWTFKKISDGIFEIKNAQLKDGEYVLNACSTEIPVCEKVETARRPQWKLVNNSGPGFYILHTNLGWNDVVLYCESKDFPKLAQDPSLRRNSTLIAKDYNYQWKIVEDSPASLPDGEGKYLIQTLKGDVLHPEPLTGDTQKLSIAAEELRDSWEIMDIGNGRCTIKSTLEDAFVDVKRMGPDGEWTPVLSKITPAPQWDIKKVGDFEYSITVKRAINGVPEPRCIALTVMNNIVTLKPINNTHNQLWFIEATDSDSFDPPRLLPYPNPRAERQPQPQPQPQPQTQPQPQPQPQPQRPEVAPGLLEGEYSIRSENGYYLYISDSIVYFPALSKTIKTYFKIEKATKHQILGGAYVSDFATGMFLHWGGDYFAFRPLDRYIEKYNNLVILNVSQLDPLRYQISSGQYSYLTEPGGDCEGKVLDGAGYGFKNWELIPRVI